jgi:hypothetical protein
LPDVNAANPAIEAAAGGGRTNLPALVAIAVLAVLAVALLVALVAK